MRNLSISGHCSPKCISFSLWQILNFILALQLMKYTLTPSQWVCWGWRIFPFSLLVLLAGQWKWLKTGWWKKKLSKFYCICVYWGFIRLWGPKSKLGIWGSDVLLSWGERGIVVWEDPESYSHGDRKADVCWVILIKGTRKGLWSKGSC